MLFEPPFGDIDASSKPNVPEALRVFDELSNRRRSVRLAGPARMQADGHHLRRSGESFAAIFVETALAHVEIIRGRHPGDEPGIVVRQTIIGNDELLLAFDFQQNMADRRCRHRSRR